MIDFFVHSFNTLSHGLLGYAVPFLFVLTIVVFFHELGHFLVARWAGVRVLTFSLGFGPELVGFNDRHGTRWKISAIPLGGYVKFFGDESEASTPSSQTLAAMTAEERAGSFHHKKVGPRAAIVAAGPIANFILGALIFAGMALYYGKPSTIARVDGVVADGAAAAAGFKIGDVVVQIDGKPIESFADMQRIVAMNAGSALAFQVKRDGTIVSLTATPALLERKDPFGNSHRLGVLGIEHKAQAGEASSTPVGVGEALKIGVEQVWFIITSTFKFLGSLFAGNGNPNEVSGVLGIAKMSGQAASAGFQFVINLCAVLSVSIGLLNLFPIPLLDGGHLMFYAAEVVRGRPLSERTQEMGFRIGLGLVLMLMVFATYNDILRMAAS
ncbi:MULTISPECIES: RIP metalloprotease RseP [Bradyrhizobium]|uniref:Zinc metalloprotease n=2 Tax=Bradyrhizobium TaxID=374 RepID=A0ABX5W7S1_9BRAD|nr:MULTISPECIES: RIP metalloprotease RseP [Bradyrhizobium]AWM01508.1 RIP metalloprotease RseP [Bradyrhizobium amphicarpaeae]AWM07804.1 RIP metalloprotease RseP [Bradyrhizobium symbiodeficiens]QDF38297.1 RIP metalloprotease RseP [Bradyrhizobium symbiodeficiens]QIP00789.1 RIP metalloprotease RseP [Bradyrhizobium symbiodeficiens]UPJ54989.1 RIP metalloprotease RseP [Bradyrhizobium sp. 192]